MASETSRAVAMEYPRAVDAEKSLLALAVSLGGVDIFALRLPQAGSRFNCRFLFSEQAQYDGQNDAQQNASHDREVKAEVPLRIIDVAWQLSEPALAHTAPEQGADKDDCGADYDE